jgi:rSAM/selenodomain-associated transferase 1
MVEDTWALATSLDDIEPILFVDEPWEGFDKLARGHSIYQQCDGDLGVRMYHCFLQLERNQFERHMIIGTDSPTLPASLIQTAFSLLTNESDSVLGPTEDGGYYLVGCRAPQEQMFQGTPWSTSSTLERTQNAFDRCGYSTRLAPPWWDVDVPEDLERLARSNPGPSVRSWFERAGKFPATAE